MVMNLKYWFVPSTVTHGCIIATLTLFGPDGKEVTRNTSPLSGSLLSLVSALDYGSVRWLIS